ncbi:MAG: HEAT repeat domain-containing protein [Polyangiaceae bacterium]
MAQDIQAIVTRIKNKDYAVQNEAKKAGGAAVPDLAKLLSDPDEEVRQLAVYCLAATGDPAAAGPLGGALFDSDDQVAMGAARSLHPIADKVQVPTFLKAYDASGEPLVKKEIGMLLGRVGQPADMPEIKKRWEAEQEPAARLGILAGTARLGDEDAQDAFKEGLTGTTGPARLPWLEIAGYIGQPWLLRSLAEVLSDTTDVLRVAVDARPDLIQALRACDMALWLIVEIGGAKLSFPVTRAQNFKPAELAEADRWVKANAP